MSTITFLTLCTSNDSVLSAWLNMTFSESRMAVTNVSMLTVTLHL